MKVIYRKWRAIGEGKKERKFYLFAKILDFFRAYISEAQKSDKNRQLRLQEGKYSRKILLFR